MAEGLALPHSIGASSRRPASATLHGAYLKPPWLAYLTPMLPEKPAMLPVETAMLPEKTGMLPVETGMLPVDRVCPGVFARSRTEETTARGMLSPLCEGVDLVGGALLL